MENPCPPRDWGHVGTRLLGGAVAHADSLESGGFTRARAFPQIPLDLRPPSCHIGMRLAVQEVPYRLIERPRPAGSRAGLRF